MPKAIISIWETLFVMTRDSKVGYVFRCPYVNRREKLIIYSKSLTNMLTLSLNAILPKAYVVNFVMLFGWKQGIWASAMLTLSLYAIVVVDGAFACYRPSVTVCFSFPEFKTLSSDHEECSCCCDAP